MENILNKYVKEKGISKIILGYKLELEQIKMRENWSLVVEELNDWNKFIFREIEREGSSDYDFGEDDFTRIVGLIVLDFIREEKPTRWRSNINRPILYDINFNYN